MVDGTLYVGSHAGRLYATDAATGTPKWSFDLHTVYGSGANPPAGAVRDGPAVDSTNVYFGDSAGYFYALSRNTGALVWSARLEDHTQTNITSSPIVFDGRVYVGVSSWEENAQDNPSYPCCTFRGQVVALDASTGAVDWRYYTVPAPQQVGSTAGGVPEYAPSGAPVWGSPTLDPSTHTLFAATGNNYSGSDGDSDSLLALDADTGSVVWKRQVTAGDTSPDGSGPDHDFGSQPNIFSVNGREMVGLGQKSGTYYAFDAATGQAVWQRSLATPVNFGTSGIQWGASYDGQRLYVATNHANPGTLYALDPATGNTIWSAPDPPDGCSTGGGAGDPYCQLALTPAVTTSPGLVYEGSEDGKIRVYSAQSGNVLWQYDTAQSFVGLDGSTGVGGSLSGNGGAVVSNGMLYVESGYYSWNGMPGGTLLAFSLTGAPSTSIDSGPSGGTSATSATFSFSSSTAGASFQCRLDADAFASCSSPQTYSSLAPGAHCVTVRAIDGRREPDPTPPTRTWQVVGSGAGSPYRSLVMGESGLVSYWRLGESSCGLAVDERGANSGTYSGGVTLGSPGALASDPNTAASLNGVDGFVTVPSSASLGITGDMSIEAWVKPSDYANYAGVAGKTLGNLPAPYDFYLARGSGVPVFLRGDGTRTHYGSLSGTRAPPLGAWSHLVVTQSGKQVTFYLNGAQDGTGTMTSTNRDAGTALQLGSRNDRITMLKGGLDEIAIYNGALTPTQVANHYNTGVAPPPAGPVAAFGFSPGSPVAGQTVAFDASGSSNQAGASITAYAWDFGDGSSGSGAKPSHAYAAAGIYSVTLKVTDSQGRTNSVSHSVGVTSYRSRVMSESGLVSYWRLGESTGTASADEKGANGGTYNGGVTLGSAGALAFDPNTAASLNGVNGFVTVPSSASLGITGDMSIEAWVKPSDYANYAGVAGKTLGNLPAPYDLYLARGSGVPVFLRGDGTRTHYGSVSGTSAPPLGAWSHLVVTQTGNQVTFYLNGAQDGTGTMTSTNRDAGTALQLGSRNDGITMFKGGLDEVAIYNSALTPTQVANHYNAGVAHA